MTTLQTEGFEDVSVLSGYTIEAISGGVTRSTSVFNKGAASAKFVLNEADTPYGGGGNPHRAEIQSDVPEYEFNQDYWLGMNVYLENWISDPEPEQIIQFHNVPNFGAGETWGTLKLLTPFGIQIKNNIYEVVHGFVIDSDAANPNGVLRNNRVQVGAVNNNGWTKWVIHCRWHYSTGILEVWKDDVLVYSKTGNTYYNDETGPYHKVGVYKWPWTSVGNVSTSTQRIMYLDNWKIVQGADAVYNDVNPNITMATSNLENIKIIFAEAGNYQLLHSVSDGLLTTEKVVDIVIDPEPVTPPAAPDGIGYAYYLGEPTGGAGGDTVVVKTFAALKTALNASAPKIIVVEGQLNGGGPTKDFGIFGQASNKTIIGMPGAIINGFGLWFVNKTNIVIKNLIFKNMPAFPAGASLRDYILFEGTTRYLVENCALYKGDGTDGCIDSVKNADLGTIMNCYFYGSSRASMSGYHTDPDKARLTYYGNHFVNCLERSPSYGGSTDGGHVINNFYEHVNFTPGTYKGYGIATRGGGTVVRTDNNSFKNFAGNPLVSTIKSYDADGVEEPAAQFSGIATNLRVNSGNNKLVTLTEPSNPVPYDYSDYLLPAADVENYVRANAGAKMTADQVTAYIASL